MKHFFRNYFWVLPLAFALLTGCSTEQEVGLNTDSDNGYGKITFSFPMASQTTTYGTVEAFGNESYLDLSDMIIYMVGVSEKVEAIFDVSTNSITTSGSGTAQTATISIANTNEISSAKTFYFVANTSSAPNYSNIKVGDTLSDLLKLTTDDQKTDHIKAINGLLLTGSATVQANDLTSLTPAPISVSLKRRVARFDISNNLIDTGITIEEIHFTKAQKTALVFADKDSLPKTKINPDLIDFTDLAVFPNANGGTEESVFYLYPSDSVSIQLKGKSYNGTERFYNIPLPKGGIQANKRYTLKTNGGPYAADFKLEVNDWMDNGDVGISTANKLEIISSSVLGYTQGWDSTAMRYDVLHNSSTTVITLTVSTLTAKGVTVDVKDAPMGYTIVTEAEGSPTLTSGNNSLSYIQTVTITIPQYTSTAAFEAKVLITDSYDSQYKTVVITREDYFPAKHLGWAGCNIYYDKNKGHLTFDDVGENDNSGYQGVCFQWGSLWGISPMGAWNGNTVLYPPAGDKTTANTEKFTLWGKDIPRILDNLFTPATGKDHRDWAYAYQATDSIKGVGDICKHLTDKGYAPAGKKWRLPTSKEFGEILLGSFNSGNDNPANAEGTAIMFSGCPIKNTSIFFPASGFRNTSGIEYNRSFFGYVWSSSPATTDIHGYAIHFSGTAIFLVSPGSRSQGFSVRCVVNAE